MIRKSTFLIMVTVLMLIFGCSLDRANPLDPSANSNIKVPGMVLGIDLLVSPPSAQPRFIDIEWQRLNEVDGYYIYRALSQHTAYERIKVIEGNSVREYRDASDIVSGRVYFYRMSAYNEYPEGRLEGRLSVPIGRQVN